MTLPADLTTITVHCRWPALGAPAAGTVKFELSVPTAIDTVAPAFIVGSATATLDANGAASVTIPHNDNPNLSPTGLVWKVTENLIGLPSRPPYYVNLPQSLGAQADLEDLVHLDPPETHSTFYGVLNALNTWLQLNNFANGLEIGGVLIAVPPGGTSRFLAADGTWRLPPSSAVTSVNGAQGAVILAAADVHAVALALAVAKGDLVVASAGGTFARLAAGSNGQLLAANSAAANGVEWTDAPSGGSATHIASTYIKTGAVTFNSDPAFALYSAIQLTVPAAAGDRIRFTAKAMWQKVGGDFIDWAAVVSGSAVRYSSSDNSTPGIEGDPGWYADTGFPRNAGAWYFVADPGDLDGSVIRIMLAHKGTAGGAFYSNANYPAQLVIENLGPAPTS